MKDRPKVGAMWRGYKMDKQKQIEEMARIIAFDLCPNRNVHAKWGEEAQCYSDNNFAECAQIKNVVDKLYNANYRKIPEGAVVLTREEYSDYLEMQNNYKHVSERCKELHRDHEMLLKSLGKFKKAVQKEMAERFAKRLKEKADYMDSYACGRKGVFIEDVDKTCKEITEGKI